MRAIYKKGSKNPRIYLLKNCVFILTCLNFSHLQSTLHLMQYTYRDIFPLLQSFWTCQFWCLLKCFCRFLFHLFHISKMFPFEVFFHQRKQINKKSSSVWDQVNREWGAWGHALFGQNCWVLSMVWAGTLVNHPSWNGKLFRLFRSHSHEQLVIGGFIIRM